MKNNKFSLEELRTQLDAIDKDLLDNLVRRFKLIEDIGRYKKDNKIDVVQNKRIKYVLDRAQETAQNNGLEPEILKNIYISIINMACEVEEKIINLDK